MSSNTLRLTAAWILSSAVGVYFALRMKSAAWVDGHYTPVGNDSFYHARRILDAAIGERGFYQFDNMIHVPEGSWLTWPWAYDYLLAKLVALALVVSPQTEPMAILAHVPVFLLVASCGILVLIAHEIRLHHGLALVALFGFALFPRNQFAYGVGAVDHHSVEMLFCLLALLLGLRFFGEPGNVKRAAWFGVVLGIAPAFHNGLFILQLPALAGMLLLWFRGHSPPSASITALAGALFASTLLVLIPSGPFRDLQFSFQTLSWFHLYAAFASALALMFFSLRRFSPRSAGLFSLLALLLLVPLLPMIVNASNFLSGDLLLLQEIAEVQSPLGLMLQPNGTFIMSTNYGWLILLAPLMALLFAWCALRESDAPVVFFAVSAVFGLVLLMLQVRLHVFGSWALFVGGAWLVGHFAQKRAPNMALLASVTGLALALAYYPAIRYQLFTVYPPGLSNDYSTTRALYPLLADACRADPGVALAYSDDGHPIRYHTDCSVIANNFLLTEQHSAKILELQALLNMTPEQLLVEAPQVDFVFARLYNVMLRGQNGYQPAPKEAVLEANEPLMLALTMRDDLPENFHLLVDLRFGDDRDYAYARIFKIVR